MATERRRWPSSGASSSTSRLGDSTAVQMYNVHVYTSVTCTRVCAHACMYFVHVHVHVHVCILVSCCLATKISKAHISKLKW